MVVLNSGCLLTEILSSDFWQSNSCRLFEFPINTLSLVLLPRGFEMLRLRDVVPPSQEVRWSSGSGGLLREGKYPPIVWFPVAAVAVTTQSLVTRSKANRNAFSHSSGGHQSPDTQGVLCKLRRVSLRGLFQLCWPWRASAVSLPAAVSPWYFSLPCLKSLSLLVSSKVCH